MQYLHLIKTDAVSRATSQPTSTRNIPTHLCAGGQLEIENVPTELSFAGINVA
jgi:hypothetical protein